MLSDGQNRLRSIRSIEFEKVIYGGVMVNINFELDNVVDGEAVIMQLIMPSSIKDPMLVKESWVPVSEVNSVLN